jgi:DNA-directed RNA polymerase specialized sigma24 family protein
VLRYYADLDAAGIALALGISRNQLATLLFRGRQRLRQRLAALAEEAP